MMDAVMSLSNIIGTGHLSAPSRNFVRKGDLPAGLWIETTLANLAWDSCKSTMEEKMLVELGAVSRSHSSVAIAIFTYQPGSNFRKVDVRRRLSDN